MGGQLDLIIIQDTRERRPLTFNHKFVKDVRIETLNYGDYGAELGDGRRLPLVFERKSVGDLWGTLTQDYERFRNEILRAKNAGVQLIIIVERSLGEISKIGYDYSIRPSSSVLAQVFYIMFKYNVPTVFCNNHSEASSYIEHSFLALAKYTVNTERGKG